MQPFRLSLVIIGIFVAFGCGFSQEKATSHEQMIHQFFQDVAKCRQSGHAPSFAPIVSATGVTYVLPSSAKRFTKFEKPLRARLQAMNEKPANEDEVLFLPILIRLQEHNGNTKTRELPDGLSEVTILKVWVK